MKDKSIQAFGSQLGDIYSFGIIMQEIIVRGAPFCMLGLTDEGSLIFSILQLFFIFEFIKKKKLLKKLKNLHRC